MDFAYSPHRETGGTLHLLSPTHPHSYRVDGFPSIKQIRRSLSRSPSKPSRFQLHTSKSNSASPGSPISPLALSRAFSTRATKDGSPNHSYPPSPLGAQPPATAKKKFTLRRTAPFRSSPRNRPASKSPRRVLSDSTNQGNAMPFSAGRISGEESTNMPVPALPEKHETEPKPSMMRFEINDGPIKFEFARSRESNAPGANCLVPAKSSPLKRSDGIMNLDQASLGSPVAKRRSLHGASFGPDFDIFDHAPTPSATEQNRGGQDNEMSNYSFSSPISKTSSPLRKSLSLRKSTLSQRHGSNTPRSKPVQDQPHEFALPGPAASRTRDRMSLDSSLSFASHMPSPFRRSTQFESMRLTSQQPQASLHGGSVSHQPHPLSNALTPSSSNSSMAGDSPTHAPAPAASTGAPRNPGFSRSLPIGATRPHAPLQDASQHVPSENGSFETPVAYKMAKPLPAAFMSTGLISKRNRNADLPQASSFASYAMPDTPSKRVSFPPMTSTPFHRSVFGKSTQPRHEFGTPTTPFSFHPTNPSPESFGKGVNIFGTQIRNSGSSRRGSFVSIDGDENSQSPSAQIDSQSSNDELPPTPTKQGVGGGRASHSKGNSLRSSLFGRRTSLGVDTFTPPAAADSPSPTQNRHGKSSPLGGIERIVEDSGDLSPRGLPMSSPSRNISPSSIALSFARSRILRQSRRKASPMPLLKRPLRVSLSPFDVLSITKKSPLSTARPMTASDSSGHVPPHTPQDSFVPPDPSNLSISAHGSRRGSLPFNNSTNSNVSFPPATPTAPRDHTLYFGNGQPSIAPITGLTQNDVDTALNSRFNMVTQYGNGEFSQVYRVENPISNDSNRSSLSSHSTASVWAVKKTKRPYAGVRDRERKLREVHILQALRSHEHIVALADSWEAKNYLYIQTEFCENGNLKDFLTQTGYKGRLDDFRIWKILLEMSLVSPHYYFNLHHTR